MSRPCFYGSTLLRRLAVASAPAYRCPQVSRVSSSHALLSRRALEANCPSHTTRWISISTRKEVPSNPEKPLLNDKIQIEPTTPSTTQPQPQTPPLLEQTAELRSTLRNKLTKNLSHENIYNLPNFLTFTRLLAAPAIGYLVLHDYHVSAALLFAYAGLTDLVDGWIARRWKLQTVVGSVIDPMADKMLMTVLTVCLAVQGALPVWLATLILGRDVALAVSACYYRYASLPAPKTLARFWDFSLPSAQVHPTNVSKANTLLQLLLIGAVTTLPAVSGSAAMDAVDAALGGLGGVGGVMQGAQLLVAGTTVWSGASYLFTKNAVEILTEGKSAEEKRRILSRGRVVLGASFASCLAVALYLES